ncbi:MAG: M81 family metallopeptidase [Spirochaetales bacterium]|nr:M81 family metallopeptidase [Spirochaetales bacterium]
MKIIVAEFAEETNSFSPIIADRGHFTPWMSATSKKEIHGFADVLAENGYETFFGPMYRAESSGKVDHAVVEEFLSDLRKCIAEKGPVGAVCLALHGATQTTEVDDGCGYIIKTVKKEYGVPVAVSFDLHANVTDCIFTEADAVAGYQTYPHRDQYNTGRRSASQLVRLLSGKKEYAAKVSVPMIAPASGYTTDNGPLSELYKRAKGLLEDGTLLDFTMFQVQPWLDVRECNAVVYIRAADPETARNTALSLGQDLSGMGEFMQPQLDSYEAIIKALEENKTGKPVIVSDFSDSPNAGSVGDDVKILKYMLENGLQYRCAFIVNDPEAVKKAFKTGIDGKAVFRIGGGIDPANKTSVEVEAVVESLHSGRYVPNGPALNGFELSIGKSAVLRAGNFDILVCNHMCITGDLMLYRHFGIEPTQFQMAIVKANTSFRLVYTPIAGKILVVDTGCPSTADLKSLPWTRIPKDSMFPWVEIKKTYKAAEHLMEKAV